MEAGIIAGVKSQTDEISTSKVFKKLCDSSNYNNRGYCARSHCTFYHLYEQCLGVPFKALQPQLTRAVL